MSPSLHVFHGAVVNVDALTIIHIKVALGVNVCAVLEEERQHVRVTPCTC